MTSAGVPASLAEWGRVDEDGTVWVRTSDGERAVGSYPGASPAEALAYFGRKYDELAGQVALLERRVRITGLSPRDATAGLERLRAAVAQARAVGDLAGLAARLDLLEGVVEEKRAGAEAERTSARESARAQKEALVGEAEQLAESSSWKASGERLRTLLEEWKAAPRLERTADEELWKRFRAARSTFDKRRRAHFAALEARGEQVRERKEPLVAEAERISTSTDWGPTAARYRELLQEWKEAGRAGREVEDRLWARFRGAQDRFFAARAEVFAERDAGLRGNLTQKEELLAEAERLVPVGNVREAKAALRAVQERWEAVGAVPRDARDRVEGRLRRVEEAVRAAEQSSWRRSNPEARHRAEETAAALRAAIEKLEAQAARARAAGQEGKAAEAEAGARARREWLAQAEKAVVEFGGRA